MNTLTVTTLFIDDCFGRADTDPRRQKINLLKEQKEIDVREIDPTNLFEFKEAHRTATEVFDLIFVDYKLSTDSTGSEGFTTGDQCESLVRALCTDTPIYLLSVEVGDDKEYERPEGFERQVGEHFLSNPKIVHQEIIDHSKLREALTAGSTDKLNEALGCDDVLIKEDLLKSLPARVRRNFCSTHKDLQSGSPIVHGTKGARVESFRWFIDLFYRHSGFLADKMAVANLLGMSANYFSNEIAVQLEGALYNGVFSHSMQPRWWIGKVKDHLLDVDNEDILQKYSFAEGCCELFKVPETEKSRCAACGELWPEALGYVEDDAQRDLHPVHISCSLPNNDVELGPYFNSPRLIIDDESASD